MISVLSLLVVSLFMILISLSVFGGGQIFMPIFNWFWTNCNKWFGTNIGQSTIYNIFSISNITPGILSPKFALVSGFYIAKGEWWGWITMFITYLLFVLPAIIIMYFATKKINKYSNNEILKKLVLVMNPIVSAIVISLSLQLIISITFPYLIFNNSWKEYLKLNFSSPKVQFFKGWRQIALYIFVPIAVSETIFLLYKKIPLIFIILINLSLAFIVFEPWL